MGCDECPSTTVGGDGERGEPRFDTVAHFPVNLFRTRLRFGLGLIGKAVALGFY